MIIWLKKRNWVRRSQELLIKDIKISIKRKKLLLKTESLDYWRMCTVVKQLRLNNLGENKKLEVNSKESKEKLRNKIYV